MKLKPPFRSIFRPKIIITLLLAIVLLPLLLIIFADIRIKSASKNYIYSDLEEIPYKKVGLVLGTVKILENGRVNLYYKYRIEAAIALYQAGKISYIVVSGDNSRKTYNYKLGRTFQNVKTYGSHEIMLNYRMRVTEVQTAEATPRFFE